MARIFFAIVLPDAVKERLERLKRLLDPAPGAVKWVEKQNLHLTLQFIGEISEDKLLQMLDLALHAAAAVLPFNLEVRGAGAFPGHSRPRVLWAGINKGETPAKHLASELSRHIGIAPDKPFSPHITLGRVREGRTARIDGALSRERDYSAGIVSVKHFVCMESTLTPGGPVYREIAAFNLK